MNRNSVNVEEAFFLLAQEVHTRAVEAPKKKAVKKAPATGGCSRLLRRLYIVNAAKRLQGDRPCSCDHFEMRLTSVRPSVQKLSAFEIKNKAVWV